MGSGMSKQSELCTGIRSALAALIATCALAFGAPDAKAQFAEATACDLMAGHPVDPDRVVPGNERADIDLEAAIATCKEVRAAAPNHARTNYNLGRVLFYSGREAEAIPYLERASASGYRQAIFVLGIIRSGPWAEPCKSMANLRRAITLDHPFAGHTLVMDTLAGRFDACADKPGAAELRQAMSLALDTISLAESRGRVEENRDNLEKHLGAGEETD